MRRYVLSLAAGLLATAAVPGVAAAATDAVTTAELNLRAGPSTGYPVVEVLPDNAAVTVYGCVGDYAWCDVSWQAARGWVSASYLTSYANSRYVPIIEYGPTVGLPVVDFVFDSYWDNYYRGRSWYGNRARWRNYWRDHRRDFRAERREDRRDAKAERREDRAERRDDRRDDRRDARKDNRTEQRQNQAERLQQRRDARAKQDRVDRAQRQNRVQRLQQRRDASAQRRSAGRAQQRERSRAARTQRRDAQAQRGQARRQMRAQPRAQGRSAREGTRQRPQAGRSAGRGGERGRGG